MRLGATDLAAPLINEIVHTVSPMDCAEPEWSRTPHSDQGAGGSDHKGGAQDRGETSFRYRRKIL